MADTTAPTFGTQAPDDNDMLYSDTAIHDDSTVEDEQLFGDTAFVQDEAPLPEPDVDTDFDDFLSSDQPDIGDVDERLLKPQPRSQVARRYERKVRGLFALGVKLTIANENTVADSAALLLHGPNIAEKAGDLAADNERFARAIEMLTDQTENPATALIIATMPLVLQVIRNHEPVIEANRTKPARTMKIPFTKRRIRFRVGFKLGKRMRNMTNDPVKMTGHVLGNPEVQKALMKQGINVVIG